VKQVAVELQRIREAVSGYQQPAADCKGTASDTDDEEQVHEDQEQRGKETGDGNEVGDAQDEDDSHAAVSKDPADRELDLSHDDRHSESASVQPVGRSDEGMDDDLDVDASVAAAWTGGTKDGAGDSSSAAEHSAEPAPAARDADEASQHDPTLAASDESDAAGFGEEAVAVQPGSMLDMLNPLSWASLPTGGNKHEAEASASEDEDGEGQAQQPEEHAADQDEAQQDAEKATEDTESDATDQDEAQQDAEKATEDTESDATDQDEAQQGAEKVTEVAVADDSGGLLGPSASAGSATMPLSPEKGYVDAGRTSTWATSSRKGLARVQTALARVMTTQDGVSPSLGAGPWLPGGPTTGSGQSSAPGEARSVTSALSRREERQQWSELASMDSEASHLSRSRSVSGGMHSPSRLNGPAGSTIGLSAIHDAVEEATGAHDEDEEEEVAQYSHHD
jgi:hypothetical protein